MDEALIHHCLVFFLLFFSAEQQTAGLLITISYQTFRTACLQ